MSGSRSSVTLIALIVALIMAIARAPVTSQAPASPLRAVPLDPESTILRVFETYRVVALGEGDHGNEQGADFRMSLIRNPKFAGAVNDIVVETGNALYQDVMDRFVDGAGIPETSLRRIWQNTTQPFATFDVPVYERFFRAVRETNARLPRSRRLRVLLGDPPLDWSRVTAEDRSEWNNAMAQRDNFPAALIRREVLAKQRRALVIYGGMHLQRRVIANNFEVPDDPARRSIVQNLQPSTEVFTIWTNTSADLVKLQPDIAIWHKPSLALTRGSTLGAADFTFYSVAPQERQAIRSGSVVMIPRDEWRSLRMEDQFDAVLYLGDPSSITFSTISRELCADSSYLDMRMARFALIGLPRSAEQLRQECRNK